MPALGYLCVFYAYLESRVTEFIGNILRLKGDDPDCICNAIDLRQKIKIAKALGFQHKPSDQWYEDLDLLLWLIDNQIIPKRNRFVHDRWLAAPTSGAMRKWYRTKIAPPQSHRPPILTTHEYVPQTADEVWDLVEEVMIASESVRWLGRSLWKEQKAERVELLQKQLRVMWSDRRKSLQGSISGEQPPPQQSSPRSARRKAKPSAKQRRLRALAKTKKASV
jgi:hypothetical protein